MMDFEPTSNEKGVKKVLKARKVKNSTWFMTISSTKINQNEYGLNNALI